MPWKIQRLDDANPATQPYRLAGLWFFVLTASLFADTHYVDLNHGGKLAPYTTPTTAAIDQADDFFPIGPTILVCCGRLALRRISARTSCR